MKIQNLIIAGIFLLAVSCASPGNQNDKNQDHGTEEHTHQSGEESHGHEQASDEESHGHEHDEGHSQEEFKVEEDSSEAGTGHHTHEDGTEHHDHQL